MDALVDFRTEVRNLTRSDISKDVKQQLFKILDNQRDQTLPQIGVTLQDTKNSSLWFIK
jgi:cysteinyl-tRNA synthetase